MKRWVISDTHFHHSNIIQYCGRRFKTADSMDERMIKNWNNIVSDDDTVYHLGDFGFAERGLDPRDVKKKLKGHIILIEGNHDTSGRNKVKADCFSLSLNYCDLKIYMCHSPGNISYTADVNFVGHTHNMFKYATSKREEYTKPAKMISCCVEQHNYTPVDINKLVSKYYKINWDQVKTLQQIVEERNQNEATVD